MEGSERRVKLKRVVWISILALAMLGIAAFAHSRATARLANRFPHYLNVEYGIRDILAFSTEEELRVFLTNFIREDMGRSMLFRRVNVTFVDYGQDFLEGNLRIGLGIEPEEAEAMAFEIQEFIANSSAIWRWIHIDINGHGTFSKFGIYPPNWYETFFE